MAAIWCGKAQHVLNNAFLGYSPVNLPVSTWTGIPQSFIQYDYVSCAPKGTILRVNEYRMTYLVDPLAGMPMTPYPPFGYTKKENLSLEVRNHLCHDHYIQNYKMFWGVKDDEDILAQSFELPRWTASLAPDRELSPVKAVVFRTEFLDDSDYASENATRNIINWHKEIEGGIWLDMGNDNETRRIHMHPWIYRQSSECDSDISEASDFGPREAFEKVNVQRWLQNISNDPGEEDIVPSMLNVTYP
ncbi:hypothetical protein LTR93_011145 [Exophiala xenobiotica]|nr:hypothetical protein LTR93_011145 [Exophiala xenobiotica]